MTYLPDSADQSRSGLDFATLDRTDRILLGSCAVVWLAALGAGVAATVALVDLTHGQADTGDSGTPWFLYTVIGVSAAVIIAAVPLLLRARRSSGRAARRRHRSRPRPPTSGQRVSDPSGARTRRQRSSGPRRRPRRPAAPRRGCSGPQSRVRCLRPSTTCSCGSGWPC
ncbi:DUF2561 family protein [Mycolicibacterium sp. PO1]